MMHVPGNHQLPQVIKHRLLYRSHNAISIAAAFRSLRNPKPNCYAHRPPPTFPPPIKPGAINPPRRNRATVNNERNENRPSARSPGGSIIEIMSAETPDSIPTSADPRSHRPTKKRALTPNSAQAASLDALFAKPDIHIPAGGTTSSANKYQPPEVVNNVQGSSAGAGSGEFHVYKAARRREYERLREMDEEVRREKDREGFEKAKEERDKKDDERTKRNREKREKQRARKAKKGKGGDKDKVQARPAPVRRDDAEEKSEAMEVEKQNVQEPAGLVIHDDD